MGASDGTAALLSFRAGFSAPVAPVSAAMAPAPVAAMGLAAVLAALALGAVAAELGAVAPVALLMVAMAAAAAVAPAVTVAVAERLACGIAAGGRLHGFLNAEEPFQPSEEAAGSRLRRFGGAGRLAALFVSRALIARIAGLAGKARIPWLALIAGITRLARVAWVAGLPGISRIAGLALERVATRVAPLITGPLGIGLPAAILVLSAVGTERGPLVALSRVA